VVIEVLMSGPRILHIMQCANLGGMEQSTLEIMSSLRELGCSNRLVSLHPIAALGPLLEKRGIPTRGLKYRGPWGILSIPEMAREFRRNPAPDSVVVTGHNMAAFCALAGIDCPRKILFIHFHHTGVHPRWVWKAIYATAMGIFPRIAFCADFIREEAEDIYPPLRRVSLTRPNSFRLPPRPTDEDRAAARVTLGVPKGTVVVGNAGWLIERKRWDVFLRTAARVVEHRSEVVFLVSGDGPLRTELMKQSIALGLEERVRWLGWQSDMKPFYLSLDVLLFNSDWDALGRTPLEAGTYEVPTVASVLHGGLREVIQSDEVGFLLDKHDEDWLAEKTLLLLKDPALRKQMGTAIRNVLAERHDPIKNANALLRLLGLSLS
jgi:glycosyltransferase involved in cell wall biosynthesis